MSAIILATLGHPITPSKIAFYSTLAVVNTFIIGAVVFNFRSEDEQPESSAAAQLTFVIPTVLLVASETLALSVLYLGRDDDSVAFTTQLLTTLGSGIFFVLLATRIVDPEGAEGKISRTVTPEFQRRHGFYVLVFALSILVPVFFLSGLPGRR